MGEFKGAVAELERCGVTVLQLPALKGCPDAVFPNNWFSTHIHNDEKTIVLWPMATANR